MTARAKYIIHVHNMRLSSRKTQQNIKALSFFSQMPYVFVISDMPDAIVISQTPLVMPSRE